MSAAPADPAQPSIVTAASAITLSRPFMSKPPFPFQAQWCLFTVAMAPSPMLITPHESCSVHDQAPLPRVFLAGCGAGVTVAVVVHRRCRARRSWSQAVGDRGRLVGG